MNKPERKKPFIICIIAAIFGAAIAIGLFGHPTYQIGAARVRFSIAPSFKGTTKLSLPPLGSASAYTHSSPIAFNASVDEASVQSFHKMLVGRNGESGIVEEMKSDAKNAAAAFVLRILFLAFMGGLLGVLLFGASRSIGHAAVGGATSAGVLLAVLGLAVATFNTQAFARPQLTNTLKTVPWIMQLVKNGAVSIGKVDGIVRSAATDISQLESVVGKSTQAAQIENARRVLVVSDLHNNPIGVGLALNLARTYDVDMVIDAGDLTDTGSDFENGFVQQLSGFEKPYVFVAGNHDSMRTAAAVAKVKGAVVPNERIVTVAGFKVMGQHDPASQTNNGRTMVDSRAQISDAVKKLKRILKGSSESPDILVVHHPEIARKFAGRISIVISGHDHTMAISTEGKDVWVRPGSTGAAGIRYFTEKGSQPMSAVILYVSDSPKVKAVAADMIAITNPNGEFTVTRKMFK